jgi:hypothetical protein
VTDQPHPKATPAPASADKVGEASRSVAKNQLLPPAGTGEPEVALGAPTPVNQLSPEEQMALFEKELKEKDWGHQPC